MLKVERDKGRALQLQHVFDRSGAGEIFFNVRRRPIAGYPSEFIIIFHANIIPIIPVVGITATSPPQRRATLKASMEDHANQHEPVQVGVAETGANPVPDLLTVSQAYDYLISEGLPRSKKTIRKWCRLNHVDWKEISVPGGAKWLITRSSLNARIAEEKLIDASLTQETCAKPSEQDRGETGPNPSEPVRDDELVAVLKNQLAHERDARRATEDRNRELLGMYHEISLASTRMGIEIGKGMQEQARTRRLAVRSETGFGRSVAITAGSRILEAGRTEAPRVNGPIDPADHDRGGDNPDPSSGSHPVQ